ncbi:hypothetical protein BE17_49625 [Sorangium cellulosum]|uniref:Uncharacterized protein n=1 Tax=Sorangium cellulosum TaxID=56 RepID=A0A150SWZ8_SORCE|nr:hypothetical protein BE17_49625 [Sorangium cellulosum]
MNVCPTENECRWSLRGDVLARLTTMDQISTATLVAGTTLAGATLLYAVLRNGTQIRARGAGVEVTFVW